MSFDVVRTKVEVALRRLRKQDLFLIQANTNERTISHKLAEYLQQEFPDRNVDCEYNRHGTDIKKIDAPKDNVSWNDTEAKTIFPDIIVHERDNDKRNLLVIEVKKSSNVDGRHIDKAKLMALTEGEYRYAFGLFLEISMNETADILEWYTAGGVLRGQKIPIESY